MKIQIATFVTNYNEYSELLSSAKLAGFSSDSNCIFKDLDNTTENLFDPFATLTKLINAADCDYLVAVHQDVRFRSDYNHDKLADAINHLDLHHPSWMVAGNAGCSDSLGMILHLDDPHGVHRCSTLPAKVHSLDENFLVFKAGSGLKLSEELSGFHFYGTDACLHANLLNGEAYVIDFLVTHLSAGNNRSQAFAAATRQFRFAWSKRILVGIISTTCIQVHVSRFRILQQLLRLQLFRSFLLGCRKPIIFLPRINS